MATVDLLSLPFITLCLRVELPQMWSGHGLFTLVADLPALIADVGIDLDVLELTSPLGWAVQNFDPGEVIAARIPQITTALDQEGKCAIH